MSSKAVVIDARNLAKRFDMFRSPRDRLFHLLRLSANRLLAGGRLPFRLAENLAGHEEFWAVRDVSFQVHEGQSFGIVGPNGSGKSTLLGLICSTIVPTIGNVTVNSKVAALLELGSGFNPEYSGLDNIFLSGQILGMTRTQIQSRLQDIVDFADIGDFLNHPVKTYSSGMVVRLAFSVAISVDPKVLVVDEALAVGDLAFQRKCMRWMEHFCARNGVLLFVSHSPEQVRRLCTNAIFLCQGKIRSIGAAKEVCEDYERYLLSPAAGTAEGERIALPEIITNVKSSADSNLIEGFASCAVQYGDQLRAQIQGAWTESSAGALKSSFQVGESFRWCMRVLFSLAQDDVVFGFSVKTKEGLSLFAFNSRSLGHEPYVAPSASIQHVIFHIDPHLGPGEYFLNCGVIIRSDGEVDVLHRVVDAGVITISSGLGLHSGLVDMEVEIDLPLPNTHKTQTSDYA